MGAPVQAKDAMITCVTCGLTYSVSQGRASCARCPLHEDCSTSCCPKCGTSNINPDKSRLARWLEKVLSKATLAEEPVEAQNSSSKIRTLDFGGGGEGVPVSSPAEARQAQGADKAPDSSSRIRTVDFGVAQHPVERWEGAQVAVTQSALRQAQGAKKQRALADVQPGREVQITGYGELNSSQRQHLQAYGLLPGRQVKVLSQHPVTIVQVEQTELAFERGIAARVLVGD